MSDVFSRYAPFIREYIYGSGWEELRSVQTEAADVIFSTDKNLLISTPTASGKTEAAFFPILSEMYYDPPASFGVLYIAPLKSLINDQFLRMDDILRESGIPVHHWHGDVAASKKTKALGKPGGILQITPESLESMLMNRSGDIPRLFSDLRYIILDEIHIMTGSDRGNQVICQISRIERLIGYSPRRIGLSATVGDVRKAADWLSAGSGRETACIKHDPGKLHWRLGAEHFYIGTAGLPSRGSAGEGATADGDITDDSTAAGANTVGKNVVGGIENGGDVAGIAIRGAIEGNGIGDTGVKTSVEKTSPEVSVGAYAPLDPGYEYIYECTRGRKSLVFSNSREETEYITATLRQIAKKRGEPDVFSIHHGNLSAAIREEAEIDLKNDDVVNTTCATVTLELGIDIGKLERVVQIEAPNSVSSLLQRIGRSGRRGAPPEMMMVFRGEMPVPDTPLPQLIPWQLIQAIAVVQLYAEERFIEPPQEKKMPLSLMFQQTLSVLASSGELTPRELAGRIMTLPPFVAVTKEDYRELLVSMIKNDFIERTETGGLIVGLKGERLISSFKFYAVFKDSDDLTVRCGSDEIGTISSAPPVGDRFALAGRVWEVEEIDVRGRLIFVKAVEGKMEISWPGDYGEVHTKILKRMHRVLAEDVVYPYLKAGAAARLSDAREVARRTGMLTSPIVRLGGYSYAYFPWVGTKEFRSVRKMVAHLKDKFGISSVDYERCYYVTFRMERGTPEELISEMKRRFADPGFDLYELSTSGEDPIFDKYDEFIPSSLLRRAYSKDRLLLPAF